MNNYIGSCGRYLWSPDTNPKDWILKTDYDSFISQHSLGRIYHCIGIEGDFIILKSNRKESYRVNPKGFCQIPSTNFYIGDKVKILSGSQVGAIAIIFSMGWHTNKKKIIYSLEINGKRRSKQYWDEDIEPC